MMRQLDHLHLVLEAAVLCILIVLYRAMAGINEDREALMGFMRSADANGILLKNWSGSDPCSAAGGWDGVMCNKGRVWHVILESRQLGGHVDANSIGSLDRLRKVSLKNNMLSGPMPTFQSRFLRCIWLSNNSFNGSIPDIFSQTPRFNKLDVSYNKLTGEIPTALVSIVNLDTLLLDGNQLTGSVPPFNQSSLAYFNVSNNDLSGPIPSTSKLQNFFNSDSYINNPKLCGLPLPFSCQEPKKKKAMSQVLKILLIVVADVILLCFISFLVVYCYKRVHKQRKAPVLKGKKEISNDSTIMSTEAETGKTYDKASNNEEMTDAEKSKLVVFDRPGRISFDLEELLRASAEMLGKGSFGTGYKALLHGPHGQSAVVVKRLRDMQSAGKREFDTQMLLLGQLQHPNIVSLLAYYYAKDEKFLVVEYVSNGSLFSLLHGTHGPGFMPLNWDSRLKIARGVARGMAYLHKSLKSQKLPHGNLKSSNILLDEGMVPKVADFGMAPLLTQSGVQCMVAFKAPEYSANKAISAHADVHSFGIILLELLTGKVPLHSSVQREGGLDLTKWVCSKTKEEVEEVYDVEVLRGSNVGEKEAMLEVAMRCVGMDLKGRPNMEEALRMVEAIQASSSSTLVHMNDHMKIGCPSVDSFVTDYHTSTHSFSSHRSSFQDLISPPTHSYE